MSRILGLDLGTTSIGWALVDENKNDSGKSSIVRLGVRVNPLTVDEQGNFQKGKSITTNADRTSKRGARRGLQRYKIRRENLVSVLKEGGLISDGELLSEDGNKTTFETYRLRAKAVKERISLQEFARVLLMINKKRGYKSSRKAKSTDEGSLIDGMAVAEMLYNENMTPGELVFDLLGKGKKDLPQFYRSDIKAELDRVWAFQKQFYKEVLTNELQQQIEGKGKMATSGVFKYKYDIYTADNKCKDKKLQAYKWRSEAIKKQLSIEEVAFVISDINGDIHNSSGYLGAIGDRSKELFFRKITVGEYLSDMLNRDSHFSVKNKVFYRNDYLNEFEAVWEGQAKYHKELTADLKREIRDIVIFHQRALKSQKGLISLCEFENKTIEIKVDGKVKYKNVGLRVCPKSSPLFQEFRIWQIINNIEIRDRETRNKRFLEEEEKNLLFAELSIKGKMSKDAVLKLFCDNPKNYDLNYKEIEGNRTQQALFNAYLRIIEMSGHENKDKDISKMSANEVVGFVDGVFKGLGYKTDILYFDARVEGKEFTKQPMYKLWHLLYSFEGDRSNTGIEGLLSAITKLCGFEREYAQVVAGILLEQDYGSLSAKAIRKILPHMMDGNEFSVACGYAHYRHSKSSLTKEELDKKELKDNLDALTRNSLRNPVVEKILNQMVNVVNEIIETYGKPDQINIELARELKNSKEERAKMTDAIRKSTAESEAYRKVLQSEFGLSNVSRNDIIRYRLYLELRESGFKTLYSNTYIPAEKLFSKEFDIEHIIPKAKLYDDSFSNKTIELRSINIEKADATAYDYVSSKYKDVELDNYVERVRQLYSKKVISKTKHDKLLIKEADIPSGFIDRDLRDTQYIAKKAKEMLEGVVRDVIPTTGMVTDRLREDWQLVDVMKELNWDKYSKLGLTEVVKNRDGNGIRKITDWSKRNDHRHHAMDALTVAFTKRSYIQYLNNMNARSDKNGVVYAIENKELYRDERNKLRFKPPISLDDFRAEAKEHLENTLISIKAKNKVVTRNVNKTKKDGGFNRKIQLTPRGQLHQETVYGCIDRYITKNEKIGAAFDEVKILTVCEKKYRNLLLGRLRLFNNDPKKAFTGKNSLEKAPIFIDEANGVVVPLRVKTVNVEPMYTIRKNVDDTLNVDKVIDVRIKRILMERLKEFGGDPKKAFSNLDENPIWFNKDKGIAIKRVSISGISNAIALHDKKNKDGEFIINDNGKRQPVDFVASGNNHHIAIYKDEKGDLQESTISLFEATLRVKNGCPIIDKGYNSCDGWQFLFTMKQNEYFVFPNAETGFDPNEVDLLNEDNRSIISPNLFRVQAISSKDYRFRHHQETTVDKNINELRNITWKRVSSVNGLKGLVKVRINHIGKIVFVGEY